MALIDKSQNFNAVTGEGYKVDTTSGNITATLPAANTIKTPIVFVNNAGANNIIIAGTINGQTNYNVAAAKTIIIASDGAYIYIAGGNG